MPSKLIRYDPHGGMVFCNPWALIVDGPRSIAFMRNAAEPAANDLYAVAGLTTR